ncbi:hypothetical protein FB565_001881 [Actinoplanes lutulentus]|uniref:LPXTG-motif cell wall-anchored protein n=1 Tax=Actinoplanes lutulentus TaxID=1287878 RepID=A0A327YYN7_9ACTN|nr:hypothetical protein [Actinoplanes lutulentus]MBB2942168.1 hypothetical protein [Actinoplanes lutulentus]RAK26878.1 hypothetical protein B0I29_12532 [Actinoplanes lutulentus]
MNLSSTALKRTGTLVAGATLGLLGVLTTGVPALACHPEINDKNICISGDGETWTVTWEVDSSEKFDGKVTSYTAAPTAETVSVSGIEVGTVIPARGGLEVKQTIKTTSTKAELTVTGEWQSNKWTYTGTRSGTATLPTGHKGKKIKKCAPTTSPSTPVSESPSTPVSESPSTPVSESPSTPVSESPSTPVSESPSTPVSESPSTPASESPSASAPVSESPSTPVSESPSATVSVTPSATPTPSESVPAEIPATEPIFVYDTTCDTLTVGIEVPSDWPEAITVTFDPTTGETQTVTAQPGETKTADFPASEGLEVVATPQGYEDEAATIAYEAPADCDEGGAAGGEGDEGGLPVTGAAAGGVAAGAVALLAIGGFLFFAARRRKLKFTA